MNNSILKIKSFCESNGYEIYSIEDNEIIVKVKADMWKVKSVSENECSLLHLNNLGKLQWHRQGNKSSYDLRYIKNCIKYHNTYKKIF